MSRSRLETGGKENLRSRKPLKVNKGKRESSTVGGKGRIYTLLHHCKGGGGGKGGKYHSSISRCWKKEEMSVSRRKYTQRPGAAVPPHIHRGGGEKEEFESSITSGKRNLCGKDHLVTGKEKKSYNTELRKRR